MTSILSSLATFPFNVSDDHRDFGHAAKKWKVGRIVLNKTVLFGTFSFGASFALILMDHYLWSSESGLQ